MFFTIMTYVSVTYVYQIKFHFYFITHSQHLLMKLMKNQWINTFIILKSIDHHPKSTTKTIIPSPVLTTSIHHTMYHVPCTFSLHVVALSDLGTLSRPKPKLHCMSSMFESWVMAKGLLALRFHSPSTEFLKIWHHI